MYTEKDEMRIYDGFLKRFAFDQQEFEDVHDVDNVVWNDDMCAIIINDDRMLKLKFDNCDGFYYQDVQSNDQLTLEEIIELFN